MSSYVPAALGFGGMDQFFNTELNNVQTVLSYCVSLYINMGLPSGRKDQSIFGTDTCY